jgi:hypothetical protein
MKGSRIALAVLPAAAMVLSGGIASAATTGPGHTAVTRHEAAATSAVHRSTAWRSTILVTCDNKARVRPASYLLACGDGTAYLTRMRWASWTSGLASGTAIMTVNNCDPSCAQGKYLSDPAIVVLWRKTLQPRHTGQWQFSRMTVIYTGKRPAHTAQSFTEDLWYPVTR